MFRRIAILSAILILLAASSAMADGSGGIKGALQPAISSDGSLVAFTFHGDIWVVDSKGGNARHITLNLAYDFRPRFSPDGKRILFTSNRGGNYDVYVTSAKGGKPTRLTFHSSPDVSCDWAADGKSVVFYSYRNSEINVWSVPVTGGTPTQLTKMGGSGAQISRDGRKLIFARGTYNSGQRRYKGSGNWDVYVCDIMGVPEKLTDWEGHDFFPFFGEDDDTVYYVSERNGTYQLFKTAITGGEGKQVTNLQGDGMRSPSLCRATNYLVFEYDFQVYGMDLKTGKIEAINITANTDTRGNDTIVRNIDSGAENPSPSPDGSKIAFSLRGDIWVMPAFGGKATQITSGPETEKWPRYSPDGKSIAFFSNKNGNNDIFVIDLKTRESKQLTTSSNDEFFHSWSPDGRFIVYSREEDNNRDIWIMPASGGKAERLTTAPGSDDDARFTPDGKSILFDSGRTGRQGIWIMDTDGGNKRPLITPDNHAQIPMLSPDGKFLVYEEYSRQERGVWVMEMATKLKTQVAPNGSNPVYSPDGKWIFFENGETKKIYRIQAPQSIPRGTEVSFVAETRTERKKEMGQVFDQAHLMIKDGFYDPRFHGVNWDALKKKYRPLAAAAETKDELSVFIARMLGELNASHLGFYHSDRQAPTPTGELGIEFDNVRGKNGFGLRIKSVQDGSPADKAWVRTGDYVYAINNKRITPGMNLYKELENTAGKKIQLIVSSKPDFSDARRINVEPTTSAALSQLKYQNWVRDNARTVARKTGNQVGYIHLRRMLQPDLAVFQQAIQVHMRTKKALVIDVRNNGGGNIHQHLLDILTRKPFGKYRVRGGKMTEQPLLYWDKPLVVLINERSFSDAEIFPHGVKALGIGEVIGVPTAGGVIGTNDVKLLDGSTFRIPRVGWYSMSGKNMEGKGCKPTIYVPMTPSDVINDRDPQLDKGVEVLLKKLGMRAAKPQDKPDKPEKKPKKKFH